MSFYAFLSRSVNFSDCDRTLLSRGHVEYIYLLFLLFALKPSLHVESSANACKYMPTILFPLVIGKIILCMQKQLKLF